MVGLVDYYLTASVLVRTATFVRRTITNNQNSKQAAQNQTKIKILYFVRQIFILSAFIKIVLWKIRETM